MSVNASFSAQGISERGNEKPELPTIANSALKDRVFTHKSLLGSPNSWHPENNEEPQNNERLAFLGSHILPHVVASKLYDMQSRYSKGELTRRLQFFVATENVAKWAEWYHLPDMMKCHPSSRPALLSNANTKAQLFHAYVGAFFEEDRMVGVEEWIRTLINYQINHERYGEINTLRGYPNIPQHVDLPSVDNQQSTESGSSVYLNSELDATTLVNDISHFGRVPSPNLDGTSTPTPSGSNAPGTAATPIYADGVNAVSKLNEFVQQGRIRDVKYIPQSAGPVHNMMWTVMVIVDGHIFSSNSHKKQKHAKLEVAARALTELHLT